MGLASCELVLPSLNLREAAAMNGDELFADSVSTLERQVAEGHGGKVLDALLVAWRLRRLPVLTDSIEALSARFEKVLPPISAKTERARYETLLDLVARKQSVDVALIVAELPLATVIRARDHVDRLAAMEPDPRVARALVDHVAQQRFTLNNTVWTGIFRELLRHGDVRAREALAKLPLPLEGEGTLGADKLRARIMRSLDTLPSELPASAETLRRLTAVQASLDGLRLDVAPPPAKAPAGRNEAELFAAVLASPADDAPRLVLADHYTERGDVRGEFISLQVQNARGATPKNLKKEAQLLKQHLVTLLGPLEPVVDRGTARFARGFLQHARVKFKTAAQRKELLHHPLLSTLESIDTREFELIRSDTLPGLRTVCGLSWKKLVELAHGDPVPKLRRVEVELTTNDPGDVVLQHLAGLPSLAEAHFELFGEGGAYSPEAWTWLLDSPLRRVKLEIRTELSRGRLAPTLEAMDRRPEANDVVLLIPLAQSHVGQPEYAAHVTRTKDGYHVVLRSPEHSLYLHKTVFENLNRRDVSVEMHPPAQQTDTQFRDAVALLRRATGDRVTVMAG